VFISLYRLIPTSLHLPWTYDTANRVSSTSRLFG
jgi:hypothetical protein